MIRTKKYIKFIKGDYISVYSKINYLINNDLLLIKWLLVIIKYLIIIYYIFMNKGNIM